MREFAVDYRIPPSLDFGAFEVFDSQYPAYRVFMMAVSVAMLGALYLTLTRTRIGLIMTQARVDGTDHLGPPGFTRQDMQNEVFGDRQYGGELVRDALVGMCRGFPGGTAPSSKSG